MMKVIRAPRITAFAATILSICLAASLALGCSKASVRIGDNVGDYSWDELKAISSEIAAADSDATALDIAKCYHLTTPDGMLGNGQSKEVELADGTKTSVEIAGFRHDDLAAGGKAGITFIFKEAVALHEMSNNAGFDETSLADDFDACGGWNASEARSWLNGEFISQLPRDLQANLAEIDKTSLVVPELEKDFDDSRTILSSSDSMIGKGTDRLWIPALVEISGVSDATQTARDYPEWTAPLRAEGAQYQLFADEGVIEDEPNDTLVRKVARSDESCNWWLRSVEYANFAEVDANGSLNRRDDVPSAGTAQGIVPCFSI